MTLLLHELQNAEYLSTYSSVLDLSLIKFYDNDNTMISNMALGGYSSIFTIGTSLILVPYRNEFDRINGQRGFGLVTQIDMNLFRSNLDPTSSILSTTLSAVSIHNLPDTLRTQQIPNFKDIGLTGFSGGFASGKYVFFIPFYNGVFSGKIARIEIPNTLTKTGQPISTVGQTSSTSTNLTLSSVSSSRSTSLYNIGSIHSDTVLQELDLTLDRSREGIFKAFRGAFPSLWQAVFP